IDFRINGCNATDRLPKCKPPVNVIRRRKLDSLRTQTKSNLVHERRLIVMARKRRTSKVLETARQRLAGVKAISPPAGIGGTLTLASFEAAIEAFSDQQDSYNSKIADLDDETNQLDDQEEQLNQLNQRILAAVRAQYGPDSSELEQLGAVRLRDRKKPVRTTK